MENVDYLPGERHAMPYQKWKQLALGLVLKSDTRLEKVPQGFDVQSQLILQLDTKTRP